MATGFDLAARFATGRTFKDYLSYIGSPENLSREAFGGSAADSGGIPAQRQDSTDAIAERFDRIQLTQDQIAGIRWLAVQPTGPAKLLVISEDWSSDCRRDIPWLARLAEAGGLELRIFNRDGRKILSKRYPDPSAAPDSNHDLMLEFMNVKGAGEFASLPVAVFYSNTFRELHRYIEYPASYRKDTIRARQRAVRPGETPGIASARAAAEFTAMQASPFFDIWAATAINEALSAMYERQIVEGD